MILGTISTVDNDNGVQLIIDGEDAPTTKKYTYMASYTPEADDRVLIEEVGGSYVIMGKIISDVASSGMARVAETAVNATSADTALSATTASTCSGNAATATVSNTTKGFDSSVGYAQGMVITSFNRTYNSTIGSYIVTDIYTSATKQFVYK